MVEEPHQSINYSSRWSFWVMVTRLGVSHLLGLEGLFLTIFFNAKYNLNVEHAKRIYFISQK